jgi:hypothetical protein
MELMLDPDRHPRLFSFTIGMENVLSWWAWIIALSLCAANILFRR